MPASSVVVRRETVVLPTYAPAAPDPNPMFLERRVYQGSSGRVYPLPFIDRISETPEPRPWEAVFIENDYVLVMLLPALGGRIQRIQDKTNGYDVIYHQPVIKPALVALAGPWISGGIEFNWPQHHRPSTFMPAEVAIEHEAGGAATVWMSEHDPLARMKGMHGVRLRPGRSTVELRARVYNRTADVQTFLWWVNIATRVHEDYQSFFPPDTSHVADHAKRGTSAFPLANGRYYGIDYAARRRKGVPVAERPPRFEPRLGRRPDDLSWYANIPVPTSYMAMGTSEDFMGGYDHKAGAGLVHVASHHFAPGKKQWTWGNHEFGYAWDRNLTDPGPTGEHGAYIELMAGAYTDNQPDFSFLQPGESRTWSQLLYPIRDIGPAHQANAEAAVSLHVVGGIARVAVGVPAVYPRVSVHLECDGRTVRRWRRTLAPDRPFVADVPAGRRPAAAFRVTVSAEDGRTLVAYRPQARPRRQPPPPATEPPAPADTATSDELYLIGLHLEQYRHATRRPEAYWREALRRDPGDSRCRLALGRWHLRRGELAEAETHLRASIARLTSRNPNPYDGEAHYQLGRCLRHQAFTAALAGDRATASAKTTEAYAAFYKATWNQAWQGPAHHALAEIDAAGERWGAALDHLERALRMGADNLRAANLRAMALRRLGHDAEANEAVQGILARDPLDAWARHDTGSGAGLDGQMRLDVALDCAWAGLLDEGRSVLDGAPPGARDGTAPLVSCYRAAFCRLRGDEPGVRRHLREAASAPPDYCFPARLEEIAILRFAIEAAPRDARAPYYLGNLLYDRRRHDEAIRCWEQAVRREPTNAVAWRNLGIGYFNVRAQPRKARAAYDRAFRARPGDARLLFERDQLWKRLRVPPAARLREMQRHGALVRLRDDLSVEMCALLNQLGRPDESAALLAARQFQPWEGGEGQALGQHVRTQLLLGRRALAAGDPYRAATHFTAALDVPRNLGEARHLLANASDIHYWRGVAQAAVGDAAAARASWTRAARNDGDFQEMAVRSFSEMTFYSALAERRLGRSAAARKRLRALLAHSRSFAMAPATIDYFATSLPTMLLFEDDLAARQKTAALFLEAQAHLGLGQKAVARRRLQAILKRDPSHGGAADLLGSAALAAPL